MLPGMTPRQWGTVLFTVMGIVLIATGALLGVTVLTQVGSDLPGSILWRFVMFIGVPIGGGFALLALRESLATRFLRDDPVQPSAMQPPDAVRVAVVVYGVWLMVGALLDFVLSIVAGHGSSWLSVGPVGGDELSFRAFLGWLIRFAAGLLLATRSRSITDLVWRPQELRVHGDRSS